MNTIRTWAKTFTKAGRIDLMLLGLHVPSFAPETLDDALERTREYFFGEEVMVWKPPAGYDLCERDRDAIFDRLGAPYDNFAILKDDAPPGTELKWADIPPARFP